MLISVIIPMRDAAAYLRECLGGVLDQGLERADYEVLVVDNGSRDGSAELCAREFPEVRLLHCATPGSYAARNLGVSQARGELLAFLDSDCRPCRGWLAAVREGLRRYELVLGPRRLAGEGFVMRSLECLDNTQVETLLEMAARENYYGYTNNMGVRRATFAELGPFVEVMRGADTMFVQKLARTRGAERIGFCPGAWIDHLELRNLPGYLYKQWLYGMSNARSGAAASRPHSRRWSWLIYRRVCRKLSLRWSERLCFLSMLVLVRLAFLLGRWRGRCLA